MANQNSTQGVVGLLLVWTLASLLFISLRLTVSLFFFKNVEEAYFHSRKAESVWKAIDPKRVYLRPLAAYRIVLQPEYL